MKMLKLVVGPLKTNCYILYEDGKCLIVDPGDEENNIIKQISKLKVEPIGILITHNHFDHAMYADSLSHFYRVPIFDHKNLFEGEKIIGPFRFDVIYTPGHSNTSLTFYFKEYNFMIVGDFVFYENIGRVDLPGGSFPDMIESLNKIKKYDDDIVLYPGHGEETTLGHEKKYNHYFEQFYCFVGGQ